MTTRSVGNPWVSNWVRLGGICGITFVVLFIVGILTQGETPTYKDTPEEISRFFKDNSDQYLITDYLIGIGFILFFLPFLSCLTAFLASAPGVSRPWPLLALIGGLSFVTAGGASSSFNGALALMEGNFSADIAVTFSTAGYYGFVIAPALAGILTLGTALVILETGIFPRWMAWLGLVVSVAGIIGAAAPIENDPEGILSAVGFILAFPAFGIWMISISVSMIRRSSVQAG